jgi:hypothetical protein
MELLPIQRASIWIVFILLARQSKLTGTCDVECERTRPYTSCEHMNGGEACVGGDERALSKVSIQQVSNRQVSSF